ncbi:hypothetical protein GCM10010915_09660 [Microbacterium faecale]|uniref:Polysaccharide pyruvyl transferase domain-containing protein n=1 Tax=Microbacterium faecale TaxID=1804630 RepID=A0A917DED6_9MICO|nr:polysaccharide pyruvyl transferase family protein [Microbacterium faecale]GGD31445.1 hypothetical protein GCM10010915_09660 [Microbacterium faecale]
MKKTQNRVRWIKRRRVPWRVGNAGDIYTVDLVRHLYGVEPENDKNNGKRLLMVGSIMDKARQGDVIAGVGARGTVDVPSPAEANLQVYGVRGPLTLAALRDAGHDVSQLRFILDPGLLIRKIFPELDDVSPEPGRVGFVPHYREGPQYRSGTRYDLIDVDDSPLEFARNIARCERVYSSSLHGVIFAHALERPVVLVAPRTAEPEFKYRDYFASVGLKWHEPVGLKQSLASVEPAVPDGIQQLIETAEFPSIEELRERGVAS